MGDIATANTADNEAGFEQFAPQHIGGSAFDGSTEEPGFSRHAGALPYPAAENDELTAAEQLQRAIAHNDITTVKALIKAGVDLRPVQWDETPAIAIAAEKGYLEIVQLLIAANANVNSGYAQLPIHSAAANGHLEIVQCLLGAGAYMHAQDCQGHTALMTAAAAGQLATVRFLLSKGAHLSAPHTLHTAFTLAQQAQQTAVCELLAEWTQGAAIAQPAVQPAIHPAVQPTPPETTGKTPGSVMDELIANTTTELNELLASSSSRKQT